MSAKESGARKNPKTKTTERVGDMSTESGSRFSARSRMGVRGRNGRAEPEKAKVSLTIDRTLLQELRSRKMPLSSAVNELLHRAVEQERLAALVAQLEEDSGSLSSGAYKRVLDQWFEDVDA